jgi:tRNA threonylcarbamoyl adenosine modification protein (Sua5/YciO/YrdC/YwlC family)
VIGTREDALAALRAGRVVAIPTDTVYGVAAVLSAAPSLFAVKQRPREVALPVLIADESQLHRIVQLPLPPGVEGLVATWWPGPLTIVLDRHPSFAVDLGGSGEAATTVGLRLPASDVVRSLCAEVGPLAVTCANVHGRPTPRDAAGVAAERGVAGAVVVDGGVCEGAPSTVVRVTRDGTVTVLRQGAATL